MAGLLTGIAGATFSTLMVSLGARRIGRDPLLDWMEIGSVLLRDRGIRSRPGWPQVGAGVLVHHLAEACSGCAYALVIGPCGSRLGAHELFRAALPWAAARSATEYFIVLPRLQPILPMQMPYWTTLATRLASACAYPLRPWFEEAIGGSIASGLRSRSGRRTAVTLVAVSALITALWLRNFLHGEPRWAIGSESQREAELQFLHHMTAQHAVGIRLARAAMEKSSRREVRKLAELMLAEHRSGIRLMQSWWHAWSRSSAMPPLAERDYAEVRGLPNARDIRALEALDGLAFEDRFLPMMTFHRAGTIVMAEQILERAADPRIRLLARSIRHTQRGQIVRMRQLQARLPRPLPQSQQQAH